MIHDISDLIPRLRRFGCMLVADPQRADAAVLTALRAVTSVDRCLEGAKLPEAALFAAAVSALEDDARAHPTVALFPRSGADIIARGTDADAASALLARYWMLPYEQRVALALTVVETFSLQEASRISRMPFDALARHQHAGIAALTAGM